MANKSLRPYLLVCSLSILFSCGVADNGKGKEAKNETLQFELVKDWPQSQKGLMLGQVTGVDVDTSQNIFLFHRAERRWKVLNEIFTDTPISGTTICELDRHTGSLVNSWGANRFIMPHGLTVDKENNVWVTDVALQQVFKFSHEGVLLMTLGTRGIAGNDSLHFNYPTDVAIANDGSFYVTDGYRNSRVMKFTKEGRYIFQWGRKGNGIGEFNIPHAVDLDSYGNVYVADRENHRVQKFDSNGKFLKEWKNSVPIQVYSMAVDRSDKIFATDCQLVSDTIVKGSDVIVIDSATNVLARFGRSGWYNGPICRYHDITIDREGNIYVADILGNQVQKFRRQLK